MTNECIVGVFDSVPKAETENARQRLKEAVGILVDEKGGIKQRLTTAYISQLLHIDPNRELPDGLKSKFGEIVVTLTMDEVYDDHAKVSKKIEKISDDEASRIARRIFDMFLEVY